MPPEPACRGIAQAGHFFDQILGPDAPGLWELTYTRANGTHATVNSVRRPGDDVAQPLSVDLLYTDDARISAIHCFIAPPQVGSFIDLAARRTSERAPTWGRHRQPDGARPGSTCQPPTAVQHGRIIIRQGPCCPYLLVPNTCGGFAGEPCDQLVGSRTGLAVQVAAFQLNGIAPGHAGRVVLAAGSRAAGSSR